MKVFNFFAQIFAIFSFLTLGSLMLIIGLHILSLDDAILKIREVYASPWSSLQYGFMGLLCITIGLAFSKTLLKKGRESEAVIYQSEIGPVVVSVRAIEDAVKRIMKKFPLAKEWKIKTLIQSKDVEIRIRLILWSGGNMQELLTEIQDEVSARVRKLLGNENRLKVLCDVQKIEDHRLDISSSISQDQTESV